MVETTAAGRARDTSSLWYFFFLTWGRPLPQKGYFYFFLLISFQQRQWRVNDSYYYQSRHHRTTTMANREVFFFVLFLFRRWFNWIYLLALRNRWQRMTTTTTCRVTTTAPHLLIYFSLADFLPGRNQISNVFVCYINILLYKMSRNVSGFWLLRVQNREMPVLGGCSARSWQPLCVLTLAINSPAILIWVLKE